MEFTGERVIPGQVDTDLWQEHLARYMLARSWVAGGRVLDAGCGSGYGSALLAETAKEVIGLDLSAEALAYAGSHYQAPHLSFRQGDCGTLPLSDAELDWVVAFEVIEHLPDAEAFLREVRRVLRPKGRLVVSTPNRRFYSDEHRYHNPFHTREYDVAEFETLLKGHFQHCVMLEQNHVPAVAFQMRGRSERTPLAAELPAGAASAQAAAEPHFLVALCSAAALKDPPDFLVLTEGGNVLRERELHIHKLEADLKSLQEDTNRELELRLVWVQRVQAELELKQAEVVKLLKVRQDLEAQVAERQREAERLDGELKKRSEWALDLQRQVEEKDALILNRQKAVQELEEELKKRSEWALGLDRELHSTEDRLREIEEQLAQRTRLATGLEAELAERTAWVHQLSEEANALRTDLEVLRHSLWHRLGRLLLLSPAPSQSAPAVRPAPKGDAK